MVQRYGFLLVALAFAPGVAEIIAEAVLEFVELGEHEFMRGHLVLFLEDVFAEVR